MMADAPLAAASSSPPVSPRGWLMAERLRHQTLLGQRTVERIAPNWWGSGLPPYCATFAPASVCRRGWRRTFVVTEVGSLMFRGTRPLLPSENKSRSRGRRFIGPSN